MLSSGAPFSSGGKYYIAGAVKSCFAGIFQNGDDETYPNDLHGNIIADTKGCAGDWNQKQRASEIVIAAPAVLTVAPNGIEMV